MTVNINNTISSNKYFSTICTKLEKSGNIKPNKENMVFSSLKILEYWVRILQQNPECVNSAVAIRLMDEKHTITVVEDVVKMFKPLLKKPKKKRANQEIPGCIDEICIDDDEEDGMRTDVCSGHFLRAIKRYIDEDKPDCHSKAIANLLKAINNADSDDMNPMLYQELQRTICDHFLDFAMYALKKGVKKNDTSFARVQKVKETYRLNDDELEMLLYLWLRDSPDFEIQESERSFLRHRRFRDNENNVNSLMNIARATGFSTERISELLGKNSALNRLNLLGDSLDLPNEVCKFLSGYSDGTKMKAFAPAPSATVNFEQLQGKNPDARLLLTMLKNHDRNSPLNVLLYGVPGTGKTELAKALAAELNVPLWEVSIDVDDEEIGGRRLESRNNNLLQYRLRAVTLADWHCEKNPGIILVDEADMVLNFGEKGSLNHFFETLRTPVIWISNKMNFVEDSTRRRFDFSMAFKPLAKDERLSVLNSVLKAQDAEDMLTDEEKLKLVVEYPAMAGGLTLAVQRTKNLIVCGATESADSYKTIARILKAHTHLMGIRNGNLKDVESHAPNYSLEGLNIEGSTNEIMEVVRNYDQVWNTLEEDDAPNSLNILLYGPPGTGKTEFVRYMARALGRNLIIKRASDLLGMFVGQTEAQIAAAFEEANRTKSILFFDEADSVLNNRAGATQNHEVSKVNELLTQMENFKGIFVAATNFENHLDPASSRRFALKLGFDYLKPEGVRHIWDVFFPDTACPDSVANIPMLTPGDFNAVNGRLRYFPASSKTPERIEAELRKELRCKDSKAGRTMGF
ncbi:MAG: ATP-binding protein [Fibrobacter sp.]|nr:ATP-binding protein [Fibrobacter sp.]